MFETFSKKIGDAFASFWGQREITASQIDDALRQVRLALLEADVHFGVVKHLMERLKSRIQGGPLLKGATAQQQLMEAVHHELTLLLGGSQEQDPGSLKQRQSALQAWDGSELHLDRPLTTVLFCGLQGAGKTTQVAKLAALIRRQWPEKKVLIAACDRHRPQAVEQLRQLAGRIDGAQVWEQGRDATEVAAAAQRYAREAGFHVVLVDTAGRLDASEQAMEELRAMAQVLKPDATLFVASAALGQAAAVAARAFHDVVPLTGSIITMLDSDAKGGAVLSIHFITGRPILFEGIGERLEDLQLFQPASMADRLLGMGDTINLVRKLKEQAPEKDLGLEERVKKGKITFEDLLLQMRKLRKMGPLSALIKMLPGGAQIPIEEKQLKGMEAIILSMTPDERCQQVALTPPRRARIVKGSGRSLDEVHQLVKNLERMRKMAKEMPRLMQQMKNYF